MTLWRGKQAFCVPCLLLLMHRKRIKKEVKLLSVMSIIANHRSEVDDAPNIIRYFGSWIEDSTFYIQLEYGFYGNLSHYISMVHSTFPPVF